MRVCVCVYVCIINGLGTRPGWDNLCVMKASKIDLAQLQVDYNKIISARPFNTLAPWKERKTQPLVGRKVRTVYQTVHRGYERLARYGGKGATQREAELCALSTYRCHLFPPNSLAEIASYTRVEHWNLRLYIHACQPRA